MTARSSSVSHGAIMAASFGAFACIAAAACSATQEPNLIDDPTGDGGAASTTNSSSSSSGMGGAGGGINITGAGGSNGQGGGSECATGSAEAKLLPLNMFIAVDRSGSMSGAKWTAAKSAFTTFFQDPNAAPLRVALRFWPDDQPGDQSIHCNDNVDFQCGPAVVDACATPQVPLGPLSDPAQVTALTDLYNATSPSGATPTSAALQGATKHMALYVIQKMHQEQGIVILVTDGEPTTCNTDINFIANAADIAYQGAGVLTFAVGMVGADQAQLNQIAAGGHTGQAFMIGGANPAQDLINALNAIQAASISCKFDMPQAPEGQEIDPTQVAVNFTPMGGSATGIPQVDGFQQCTGMGGWYYDVPAMPTTINLCPATCNQVQSNVGAKIEILLGCIKDIN